MGLRVAKTCQWCQSIGAYFSRPVLIFCTGTDSTCAAITNTLVLETQKKHCQRGTIVTIDTIHEKYDRVVRNKHFVILLHNFRGIYAVLSQIWKCRKSRDFGANFLGRKIRLVLYFLLFATMVGLYAESELQTEA